MATTDIPPTISHVTGPLLLGFMFNWGLFGVLSVQTYLYYTAFPRDRLAFQLLVYGIYIIETIQTVMITWDAFQNFAFGFGNVGALDQMNLIWLDCCIFDGLVAFCVQVYFAFRLYLLSKYRILPVIITLMALAQVSGAIATGIIAKMVGAFSRIREPCFIPAMFWLGGSAACDVAIAVSMIYVLSRYNEGFHETRDLVRRLIRLTMETGSLTAAIATLDLILFLAFPTQDYHITPALSLAKFYSNSLLVVFNSRIKIAGSRGESSISKNIIGLGSSRGGHPTNRTAISSVHGAQYDVEESVWRDSVPMSNLGPTDINDSRRCFKRNRPRSQSEQPDSFLDIKHSPGVDGL
ncbi:hypothetical protein V5O48_006048 [Marasmius crinis-equi]|uniref:DUF6534 domain-containing protein n=1 Tax=Marasmius crinis-equi TaxID=585013 RepID=A0ABR3FKK8_9AGAR